MVPRVDIVGIDAATPWSEVLDRVRSLRACAVSGVRRHARRRHRHPVREGRAAGDRRGRRAAGGLALARAAAGFIPTSKRIDAQLRDFQSSRTHIAIVSDEYGGTAGLVTIEDMLEEIVGEIRDEYDVEEPQIEQEGPARYWVSGVVSVDELSELLGADFGVEDVTTVGGLVYALFGRVPQVRRVGRAQRIPHRRRARAPASHRARVLRAAGTGGGCGTAT